MSEDLREDPGEFYPGGTVVPGVPGGGSSVTVDDALTQDGENPVKSKGIWSAIWGAISPPAASVYAWATDELAKKQDKLSQEQLAAVNSGITAAKVSKLDGVEAGAQKNPDLSAYAKTAEVPAAIAGKEINPSSVVVKDKGSTIKMNDVYPFNFEKTSDTVVKQVNIDVTLSNLGIELHSSEMGWHSGDARYGCEGFNVSRQNGANNTSHSFYLDVKIGKVTYEGSDAPSAIENTIANVVNAMPRYRFVDAAIVDGVVTVAPYTNAKIASDGTAFAVEVGEGSGYARDCVLVVDCGETSPSVIFDATVFFPRGGDAANLEVVAGKRNVFFITEVQPNQFMVARDELELPDAGGGE